MIMSGQCVEPPLQLLALEVLGCRGKLLQDLLVHTWYTMSVYTVSGVDWQEGSLGTTCSSAKFSFGVH